MSWYTYNQAGVLIEKGDDVAQTVTDYNPSNGAVVSTTPYTAAQIAQANQNSANATAAANLATLQQRAQNALTNNQNYLAIVSPTNAQVVAQVAALTRQVDALIRMAINQLSTISDA